MNRFTYDKEADALYIYISEGTEFSHTRTVLEDEVLINIDYDIDDQVLGIEIIA